MTKEWLWWLGEFGLAATVAVVAGFVTRDVPISILYGLFVGTVFFVLRQNSRVASQFHREVTDLEDKALNLPMTMGKLEYADPILKRFAHSARDEAIRYIKGAVDGEISINYHPPIQVTIDVFKQAKPGDKVFSTNYWSGFDTFTDIWRQTSFDLAANGIEVTRVFVEGTAFTPEEKKRQREEMDRQKDHINVRFVKESLLPSEARIPFLLIYERIFGLAPLTKLTGRDKGVIYTNFRLYTRRDEVEKGMALAETILKLSEEYK